MNFPKSPQRRLLWHFGLLPQRKEISRHRGDTALSGGEFSAPGWCVQFGGSCGSGADFPRAATFFRNSKGGTAEGRRWKFTHIFTTLFPLRRFRKILAPQRILKFRPQCPPFFSTPHPAISAPGLSEARSSGVRNFPDPASWCSCCRPEQRILPPQAPWSEPQQK